MKYGTLDPVTGSTFAWIRNRPTAAEREEMDPAHASTIKMTAEIHARDYRADKGRIRRLREKLERLLAQPSDMRARLVSPKWFDRFEIIPDKASEENAKDE